jgi:hydrogenase nickel incorporation protein HypA/HybF
MHERSLVKALIEQIIEEAARRKLGRLHEVRLQLGEFSGVEPALVESAFAEMAVDVWGHAVRLVVEVVPLTARCPACALPFHVNAFRFICPRCGGGDEQITAGEELQLVSLRAERRAACESTS